MLGAQTEAKAETSRDEAMLVPLRVDQCAAWSIHKGQVAITEARQMLKLSPGGAGWRVGGAWVARDAQGWSFCAVMFVETSSLTLAYT